MQSFMISALALYEESRSVTTTGFFPRRVNIQSFAIFSLFFG